MVGKVISVLLHMILIQSDSNKNVALLITADISKEAREKLITEYVRETFTNDRLVLVLFILIVILAIISLFF